MNHEIWINNYILDPFQYKVRLSRCGMTMIKNKTVVIPSYLYNGTTYL